MLPADTAVQIGLEIPCTQSETELPKCFSYTNCVTPRLYPDYYVADPEAEKKNNF